MVNLVTETSDGKGGKLGERLQMVKMVNLVTETTDGKDGKLGDREYKW